MDSPNSPKLIKNKCPHCGGDLLINPHDGALYPVGRQPAHDHSAEEPIAPTGSHFPAPSNEVPYGGSLLDLRALLGWAVRVGLILAALFLLAVLFFNAPKWFDQLGNALTEKIAPQLTTADVRPESAVVLAPRPNSKTSDLLIPIADNLTTLHQLVFVDGETHELLWRTDNLSDEYYNARIFPYEKQVYLLDHSTLSAYDRQKGTQLWKTNFDLGLGSSCKTCLLKIKDTLMVYLKDGSVQAVNSSDGKIIWQRTFNNTYADLFEIQGKPALQEKEEDGREVILVLDPLNGQTVQRLAPACSGSPDQQPNEYRFSADQKTLALLYDDLCLQWMDLSSGETREQTFTPAEIKKWPSAWFATQGFVTPDAVYYTENGQAEPVYKIDSAGEPQLMASDSKYNLLPRLVSGGVLVLEATPTYDSNLHEFWGINATSGSRLWQFKLKGDGPLSNYDIHPASDSLTIVQCRRSDPDTCFWTTIGLLDGQEKASGQGEGSSFNYFTWDQNQLYLVGGRKLWSINTTDASVTYTWP